jgi:internalin A
MSERIIDQATEDQLDLSMCAATDARLRELKREDKLITLTVLNLTGTFVTDAGLAELSDLTGLRVLKLNNTKITDAGLSHLSGLTGLEELDINWTDISDDGLSSLRTLGGLKMIDLRWTNATITGRQRVAARTSSAEDNRLGNEGPSALFVEANV